MLEALFWAPESAEIARTQPDWPDFGKHTCAACYWSDSLKQPYLQESAESVL